MMAVRFYRMKLILVGSVVVGGYLLIYSPGMHTKNQLLPTSRQASSNASDGVNRESSLDDSGVVDDHEDQDINLSTAEVRY